MTADRTWCVQCGTPLPADARFCEMCGAPVVAESVSVETVIGHLPGEIEGRGRFGRSRAINLVITTTRLISMRETRKMHETWVAEFVRMAEEDTGLSWRYYFDHYDWRGPLWAHFYETPPDQLHATHRDNEAIPLSDVLSATITLLEEGGDTIDLVLTNGETLRLVLFDQMGQPAARFLTQALGSQRVQLVS